MGKILGLDLGTNSIGIAVRNEDRRIQTARIGKYYFFNILFIHNYLSFKKICFCIFIHTLYTCKRGLSTRFLPLFISFFEYFSHILHKCIKL